MQKQNNGKNKEVPPKITSEYANLRTVTHNPRTIHAHEASVKYNFAGGGGGKIKFLSHGLIPLSLTFGQFISRLDK